MLSPNVFQVSVELEGKTLGRKYFNLNYTPNTLAVQIDGYAEVNASRIDLDEGGGGMAFKIRDLLVTVVPDAGSIVLQCDAPTRTCGLAGDSATVGSCTSEGCSGGLLSDQGDPAYYRELLLVLEQAVSDIRKVTNGKFQAPKTLSRPEIKSTERGLEDVLAQVRRERD